MRKILEACPSCGAGLYVSELSCEACETVVRGRWETCAFCRLPIDDLRFLEIFVACRGNVKEMERETGLGYWTIRGRLGDVIERLQLATQAGGPADPADARREVLEAVARGELPADEAERLLARLGGDAG